MPSCTSCPSSSCSSAGSANGSDHCRSDAAALQDAAIGATLNGIRHKIFVMSGKGGVGKSSVTVNTATALANAGYKVGILDVDIHGPSVPNLLGLRSAVEVDKDTGRLLPVPYSERLGVISMDSLLRDKNQAVLWRGPKKTTAIRQFIADVQWEVLDYLVIDSPPGTGDEHMTILKMIADALCLVVTTPQEISLADVRKTINFLQYAGASILGVVENMSEFVCPHCRQHIPLFKSGGGSELAKQYGLKFLGAVPLDPVAVESADQGVPVVCLNAESPAKTAFLELANNIIATIEKNESKTS